MTLFLIQIEKSILIWIFFAVLFEVIFHLINLIEIVIKILLLSLLLLPTIFIQIFSWRCEEVVVFYVVLKLLNFELTHIGAKVSVFA